MKRHAIEAARACFGDAVADQVKGDADRIAEEIGGRWDAYTAAIFLAKTVKRGVSRHLPYFHSVAERLRRSGVTAEAKAARDQVLAGRQGKARLKEYLAKENAKLEAIEAANAEIEAAVREEARSMIESLSARGVGLRLDGEDTVRFVDAQGVDFVPPPELVAAGDMNELRWLKPQIKELLKERDAQAVEPEVTNA